MRFYLKDKEAEFQEHKVEFENLSDFLVWVSKRGRFEIISQTDKEGLRRVGIHETGDFDYAIYFQNCYD